MLILATSSPAITLAAAISWSGAALSLTSDSMDSVKLAFSDL